MTITQHLQTIGKGAQHRLPHKHNIHSSYTLLVKHHNLHAVIHSNGRGQGVLIACHVYVSGGLYLSVATSPCKCSTVRLWRLPVIYALYELCTTVYK